MTRPKEQDNQQGAESNSKSATSQTQTGDPGVTPGSAEGDEQTVDESLQEKESKTKE